MQLTRNSDLGFFDLKSAFFLLHCADCNGFLMHYSSPMGVIGEEEEAEFSVQGWGGRGLNVCLEKKLCWSWALWESGGRGHRRVGVVTGGSGLGAHPG